MGAELDRSVNEPAKVPIARLVNQADGTSGAFLQSRYKSMAVLDIEALLAVCAYIDLNVFAAGMAELPEVSPHTSLRQRVLHCQQQGRIEDLQAARQSSVAGALATQDLKTKHSGSVRSKTVGTLIRNRALV